MENNPINKKKSNQDNNNKQNNNSNFTNLEKNIYENLSKKIQISEEKLSIIEKNLIII